jgi:hypothetical protein
MSLWIQYTHNAGNYRRLGPESTPHNVKKNPCESPCQQIKKTPYFVYFCTSMLSIFVAKLTPPPGVLHTPNASPKYGISDATTKSRIKRIFFYQYLIIYVCMYTLNVFMHVMLSVRSLGNIHTRRTQCCMRMKMTVSIVLNLIHVSWHPYTRIYHYTIYIHTWNCIKISPSRGSGELWHHKYMYV